VADINLNEILHRYIDDYREVYDYLDITLKLDEKDNFQISMNETLAVVLVTNLLKNAFVHNREQGTIHISIDKESIIFVNTGDEASLDGQKIFQRFYQGKKKEGSTGLGLAIVRAICELFKLDIRYSYFNKAHRFTITRS
jgi:signal transduction histidine kinase